MSFNRIVAAALVALCLVAAVLAGSPAVKEESGGPNLVLGQGSGQARILSLTLQGAISGGGSGGLLQDGGSANALRNRLLAAAKDQRTRGILLRINSPGGTVGTSQEVYRAIRKAQEAGKPVIVSMQDVAASGGYYIASAADKIYANPGTLTGSIGVIIQGLDVSELIGSLGISPKTYKTGEFKDVLSPYRPDSPTEEEFLQSLIDGTLDQFIGDVSQGRQRIPEPIQVILDEEALERRAAMDPDQVRRVADGRIFTGEQALALGLIDALGGSDDALADLRLLLGDEEERLPVQTGSEAGFDQFLRLLQTGPDLNGVVSSWLGIKSSLDPLHSVPVLWMSPLG